MIISISDLDDSQSLLGTVQDQLYGFPTMGLSGLYLLEEFIAGEIATAGGAVLDSSVNGNDGVILSGSVATATAFGLETPGPTPSATTSAGFAFNTGVPFYGPFTAIAALQINSAPADNTAVFVTSFDANSAAVPTPLSSSAFTGALSGLFCNIAAYHGGAVGGADGYDLGVSTTPSSGNRSGVGVPATRPSWIAAGVSVAPDGSARLRNGGALSSFNVAAYGAADEPANQTHVMGAMISDSHAIHAQLGLFALYNRVLSDADLQTALAAARTRMLLRGVPAPVAGVYSGSIV